MDLAWISLAALVITLVVSCTTTVNPGFLAIVFAWLIGAYVAPRLGTPIGLKAVVEGFPSDLFLTLTGVTLLFSLAKANGTLDRLAHASVRACQGNVGLVPVMFFLLALGLATIGAGNIAAAALVAPMAMTVAARAGIPGFLMAIMVAHGAIAGALSPFAPTGIIADTLMTHMGLGGHRWHTFLNNLLANAAVAAAGYLLFGGWRLFGRVYHDHEQADERKHDDESAPAQATGPFELRHHVTLALIAALIIGVVGWEVRVGMGAFLASVILILGRLADEREAVRVMPWSVILMVCGVTVLTHILELTGGIDRFTSLQARLATPRTVTGVTAFVTGLISVYSSTSGVVLPVFLPTVPKLIERLGAGDPLAIASSMMVGGHLVDSSPLSTIGALCVACAGPREDRRLLFNKTLAWGLSMALVGAVVCYLFFGRA